MKKYSAVYYLLFVLITMGAFASMAQNAYGLRIVGVACLGFALTFLNEIFFPAQLENERSNPSWMVYAELISLTVVSLIFFMRNFSLDFAFLNPLLIFSMAVLLLLLFYQALTQIGEARLHPTKLVVALVLYYGAIFVFILSFLTSILLPDFANPLAVMAMLIVTGFAVFALISKQISVKNETISIWQYVGHLKNKSAILLITFTLIYGYHLLYSAGTLPPLYRGTLPEGYQHLVERSIANNDQQKLREFKARYEEFVRKYSKD